MEPTQSVLSGINVPVGHIICKTKWKGSELATVLKGSVGVLFEEDLGAVDFYPSKNVGVVFIDETELTSSSAHRRRIVKLRKCEALKGVVLVERNASSSSHFPALQKFTVIELGMVLLPVGNLTEAANVLAQMVHVENQPQSNGLRIKWKQPPIDGQVLETVQLIPKLGEVKSKILLEHFKSISAICNASEEVSNNKIISVDISIHSAWHSQHLSIGSAS